jgi:hypothetical protein
MHLKERHSSPHDHIVRSGCFFYSMFHLPHNGFNKFPYIQIGRLHWILLPLFFPHSKLIEYIRKHADGRNDELQMPIPFGCSSVMVYFSIE